MFLIVLAALTLVSGIALVVMARRRRLSSNSSEDGATEPVEPPVDATEAPQEATRRIDEYAIPVSFERARDLLDDEVDIGKICPRCGARYGSHHRFCERDNSELAALN
jgi:hypothetical protein